MRFLLVLCSGLLIAAVAFLVYETREIAALAGRHEIAARDAAAAAAKALDELASERQASAAARADVERLERELARATAQLATMADAVRETAEGAERRLAAAREAERRSLQAMPPGVRRCLDSLHTCLHAEGYGSVRFLRAQSLDERGLHGVEAIQSHADGLGADFVVAATMTAALDRDNQRLSLTFFDGTRTENGERVELPAEGWSIVFAPVDGRLLEERLPYLIAAEGVYPRDRAAPPAGLPTDVDAATRLSWLERFDRLLEAAGTSDQIQVQRFRGLEGATFLTAQVLATDARDHVVYGASCGRLAVEVDRDAGVVWLVLRDGILNRGEATSTITAEGYRILLPKIEPDRAVELMLGLVVYQ